MAVFLRPYQDYAVREVVRIAKKLGPRSDRLKAPSKRDEGESGDARTEVSADERDKRITLVVSPTASGKSVIMKGIEERLAESGILTLALTHVTTVAQQNQRRGLISVTVQSLFHAFDKAMEEKLRSPAAVFRSVASRLELPPEILDKELCVLVDEAHYALEKLTLLYRRVLDLLPGVRMVVGFTATPRTTYFNTINLTPVVQQYVAPPRGSVLHAETLWTLPYQLGLFPGPGLVFTRSVATAALVTMAANVIHGKGRAMLLVSDARSALESYVLRLLLPSAAPAKQGKKPANGSRGGGEDVDGEHTSATNDDDAFDAMDERSQEAPDNGGLVVISFRDHGQAAQRAQPPLDMRERRLGVLTMLLTLDALQKRPDGREELARLAIRLGQVPRVADSLRLIDQYRPELADRFRGAVIRRRPEDVQYIAKMVAQVGVAQTEDPSDFTRGGALWGVSVYRVAEGFDFPPIRFVAMAESVMDSRVLYQQRAGRGARRIVGRKEFYDLIDVVYRDKAADPGDLARRVTWTSSLINDPAQRHAIQEKSLIFREPCVAVNG